MNKKETILDLYFNKHLKQKEIANQVETSQQYISKIIKTDERYNEEKSSRKSINAEKRKITQAEYQKNYVRTKKNDKLFMHKMQWNFHITLIIFQIMTVKKLILVFMNMIVRKINML